MTARTQPAANIIPTSLATSRQAILFVLLFFSFCCRQTITQSTGYAGTSPRRSQLGRSRKQVFPSLSLLFKLKQNSSSWEYPFTVQYWLIMGLKVMTLENLKPNPSCQSLSSLWCLNTSSSSSSGSLSSSSPTSPPESSSRLFSVEVAIFQICFRCRERSC